MPFDMGGTSHRHLADRRAASASLVGRRACWPASASRCAASTSPASAPAAARSRSVDAGGMLRVGPESAGSVPGPACYGNGGTAATVTDANVVLGYLDPDNFMGGERRSIARAAEAAVDRIAEALGIVAHGGRRGHLPGDQYEHGRRHPADDAAPRRRSAPVCAAGLRRRGRPARDGSRARTRDQARRSCRGGLRAVGLGHADHAICATRSRARPSAMPAGSTPGRCARCSPSWRRRAGPAASAEASVRGPGCGSQRSADMRYGEQIFEIERRARRHRSRQRRTCSTVADPFHAATRSSTPTRAGPGGGVRQRAGRGHRRAAIAAQGSPVCQRGRQASPFASTAGSTSATGTRVPVFDLEALAPGLAVHGPALVEFATTTALVAPGRPRLHHRDRLAGHRRQASGRSTGRTPGSQETTHRRRSAGSTCSARG